MNIGKPVYNVLIIMANIRKQMKELKIIKEK